MDQGPTAEHSREYMTALLTRRSVVALLAGLLTLALSFYGIVAGVIRTIEYLGRNGFASFIYYTMLSNLLAALSVAFVIPFAVEGVRNRRFTLPRWVAVMHYLAACSIAVMAVFVALFMSWASPEDAFGGSNIVTHVACPILILLSFFQTENGYIFSTKDKLIGALPFYLYTAVYFVEALVIGESRGGWPDIYRIGEYVPPLAAIPFALAFGFAVSSLVAGASNALTRRRMREMFEHWTPQTQPFEVRIEAYGLGRLAGQHARRNAIPIPYDILEHLASTYQLSIDDLLRPFMKGLQNELEDREGRR